MKNTLSTLLLVLVLSPAFSQNYMFGYQRRNTPTISKEELNTAKYLNEIMPGFCHYFILPFDETVVSRQLALKYYSEGYSIQPRENYEQMFEYITIEISGTCNGKLLSAKSLNDELTLEQKNILYAIDYGSEIKMKIKFKYKYSAYEQLDKGNKIKDGEYAVTVVPEKEAEYPGGFGSMSAYVNENVISKVIGNKALNNVSLAIVRFTVNEDGQLVNPKLIRSTSDPKNDKLILDAFNKMPKWKPAMNNLGMHVKQEFTIPFGGAGC